jgi:Lrp/AsnC family transcriptional regulator for asnA, asnC and gidA
LREKGIKLDRLDSQIIRELQKEGRQSYLSLSKKLGVVEGTIRKRFKRLQEAGILRVSAIPDLKKLGYGFICIMGIQVKMEDLPDVAKKLSGMKNICYLTFVTGSYDLMAVVVTKSPEELSHFIQSEISEISSILKTETFVNLDIIKGSGCIIDTTQIVAGLSD